MTRAALILALLLCGCVASRDFDRLERTVTEEKSERDAKAKVHDAQLKSIEFWVGMGAAVAGTCITYLTFRRDKAKTSA